MASITKRTTAQGEARYDVRYRTPGGKVRNRTFKRRRDADRFITGTEADKLEGRFVDPRSGRMTLAAWWDEWWPTVPNLRASSRARDESYYHNHVEPAFGHLPLNQIGHQDVAAWVHALNGKGLAPATVQKAHQVLAKTLRSAVRAGRLALNPADHVDLPRIEREEMRFLDPAEVEALAGAIDARYRAFVYVGAYCGLRLGELAGLRWGYVDLVKRHLDVAEVAVEVRGQVITGPPKTRAGRRRVPMPKVVADALTAHREIVAYEHDGLVFPAPAGGYLRAGQFRSRVWTPALAVADLDGDKSQRLRIHDLRHTAVSLWIAAGANPKDLAARAGHTSVSVVLDRYGHLLPDRADEVSDRLDAMARGAAGPGGVVVPMTGS